MTQALEQKIKTLIQKTVKATLRAELAHLRADALPIVPKDEMADISRRYKRPTRRAARTVRVTL
ncbi:MAG: hypothetical protein Q7S28_03200 [bacterium]|nr:hypothetical protein [bacterium]